MTDELLIRWLAEHAMRWPVYDASHHRPGSRPSPYAWPWRRGRRLALMLSTYVDDDRGATWDNREWNPLESEADATSLLDAISARGTPLDEGQVTTTPEGRRAIAEAAHTLLAAEEQ